MTTDQWTDERIRLIALQEARQIEGPMASASDVLATAKRIEEYLRGEINVHNITAVKEN